MLIPIKLPSPTSHDILVGEALIKMINISMDMTASEDEVSLIDEDIKKMSSHIESIKHLNELIDDVSTKLAFRQNGEDLVRSEQILSGEVQDDKLSNIITTAMDSLRLIYLSHKFNTWFEDNKVAARIDKGHELNYMDSDIRDIAEAQYIRLIRSCARFRQFRDSMKDPKSKFKDTEKVEILSEQFGTAQASFTRLTSLDFLIED